MKFKCVWVCGVCSDVMVVDKGYILDFNFICYVEYL